MATLRQHVPYEFFQEYMDTRAAKYLDAEVSMVMRSTRWPGPHKNVHVWWRLDNGYAVAWNENPSRGWSFPVMKAAD